jgi:hypothetical protein
VGFLWLGPCLPRTSLRLELDRAYLVQLRECVKYGQVVMWEAHVKHGRVLAARSEVAFVKK